MTHTWSYCIACVVFDSHKFVESDSLRRDRVSI